MKYITNSQYVQYYVSGLVTRKEKQRFLVIPSFMIGRNRLSPNQLSEGTLKTLALSFYLLTGKSQLVLLEEPEVCVHHGLISSVVELIKTVANKKQIVISTHSESVLDNVEPVNVFLVRNDAETGTVARHVPRAMSMREYDGLREYLRESGNLGEFWRHGGLDS